MNLVVDTNILFSFFLDGSFTKKLIKSSKFELISPRLSLLEIERHKLEIIKKSRIKERDFSNYFHELSKFIRFIDKKEYILFLPEAVRLSPDKDDSDFLALCLKFNCYLWSNDNFLKMQNKIKVISTREIVNIAL